MKTLTNRSIYETNRNEMVNELQKLWFDRQRLVSAGENELHYLYKTMVKGIWISEENKIKYLNQLSN